LRERCHHPIGEIGFVGLVVECLANRCNRGLVVGNLLTQVWADPHLRFEAVAVTLAHRAINPIGQALIDIGNRREWIEPRK
tara:strand:- start:2097 stop:2339 length:243 start_codon:yes stop_codon:yes gene_type:complete